jgi:hypothetical protein
MEIEFVPYEQALALKELGFDEPCAACYYKKFDNEIGYHKVYRDFNFVQLTVSAPTYSQAFRWFREKYNVYAIILPSYADDKVVKNRFFYEIADCNKLKQELDYHSAYEEAELACLTKLIEIVEQKNEK